MIVDEKHRKGRIGVSALQLIFEKNFQWLFREQPSNDFGIDAHVEIVESNKATGKLLALQIKSGESYFKEKEAIGYVYRGSGDHLNYWLNHSLPVIIILYNLEQDKAYWQVINIDNIIKTNKGWKLTIPYTHELCSKFRFVLARHAEGKPHILRLNKLQLAKPWMEIANGDNCLILEVEEWVNKSSGRTGLKLLAIGRKGNEIVVRDWPMIFLPGRDYEQTLRELFPWATLEIDEEYYESYDRNNYENECGIWDSEDKKYMGFTEDYEDWEKENIKEGLRPYSDNGEVAFWRLIVSLNSVGKAFMEIEKYIYD